MSKAPSTDLFDLIKSLTKPEKRQFKLYASRHAMAGKNKYVLLFDAIDRQETYDERALVERTPLLRLVDLRSMKAYLHDLILRSLRDTLRDRAEITTVQYQIDKAEILIYKGLHAQATRLLARTKETARKHRMSLKLLDILFLESSLKVKVKETNSLERHEEIQREQIDILRRLATNVEYYDLLMRTHFLQVQAFTPRSDDEHRRFQEICKSPLLADESLAATPFARMQFYEVHARLCQMMGDFDGQLAYTKRRLEYLESEPALLMHHQYDRIHCYQIILDFLVHRRQYDEHARYRARLKALELDESPLRLYLGLVLHISEFRYAVRRCRFEEARAMIPTIQEFLEQHEGGMDVHWPDQFRYQFLTLAVYTGDGSGAFHWLGEMVNRREFHLNRRMVEQARLLRVVVCYEFADDEATESAIRSLYRHLKAKDELAPFETVLIGFLRKLPGIGDRNELRSALSRLHAALVDLQDTPDGRMRLSFFDFLTWLEAKIQGRAVRELLAEKDRATQMQQARV